MEDLYFEKEYGRLYETIEGGKCEEFTFRSFIGEIKHIFIKKPILIKANETGYYDLTTPYGYGGPVITECKDKSCRNKLVEQFYEAFQKYCAENNIVSEFVRFHPIALNAQDFNDYYKTSLKSNTTGTTLEGFDDPIQEEFSKSTKKTIRKALNAGVEYKVTVNPKSLKEFQKIYQETMKRIGAEAIYFFDETYFSNCQKYFGDNILLVEAIFQEKVIGMELHFLYKDILHTHLSGSLEEFHHLSPVYVMTYAIVRWGKENGVKLIHSGGGRSDDSEDKLYLFKKKFGKNTEFNYFTGYKIWNSEIYDQLCEAAGVNDNKRSFPAYRIAINSNTEIPKVISST